MVRLITLLVLITVAVVACGPSTTPTAVPAPTEVTPTITLTISGSGSVTPIPAKIADEFEAANPDYVLEVLEGSGTGDGVRGAVAGTLDAVAMSRAANDSEAEQGILVTQFGSSVTAVMSHPDVGVTELTTAQVKDIFTGAITNWSDVGGPELDIVVYVRDPEENNTSDIHEAFLGEDEFVTAAQVMTSQTEMQNVLTNISGAIGYGTWATVLANESDIVRIIIDGVGVDSTSESRQVFLGIGYLANRITDVEPLINWLSSEDGHSVLAANGVFQSR